MEICHLNDLVKPSHTLSVTEERVKLNFLHMCASEKTAHKQTQEALKLVYCISYLLSTPELTEVKCLKNIFLCSMSQVSTTDKHRVEEYQIKWTSKGSG